jgi:alpha-beta hydrolase superfamily lysophospholipase
MKRSVKSMALALCVVGVFLYQFLDSRASRLPELQIWHTVELQEEFVAADAVERYTFNDYLLQEEALFVALEERFEGSYVADPTLQVSRYAPNGFNNPKTFPQNWNRTFELAPAPVRGGALLLHGLSDSPYSLRRVGEILAERGYYVLGLRLPGHGTLPSGLLSVRLEDWQVAVKLAVHAVRDRVGEQKPWLIAGYSNGASLAVDYALDALEDENLPQPDQLILFSPAVGISSLARFAEWHRLVSFLSRFETLRWTGIVPEYDPYKYNSFTKNAATQSYRITRRLQRRVDQLYRRERTLTLPPILTFASLVDSTVMTQALIHDLYNKLDNPESELVIFDVNRLALMKQFYRREPLEILDRMEASDLLPYRLTVVGNEASDSFGVVEWSKPAHSSTPILRNLGMQWPDKVFSLSHVAIPFPPDDPIYGKARSGGGHGLRIGALEPRGEKQLLTVPADLFLRLRHNPFFPYVEERLIQAVGPVAAMTEELP